MMASDIVSTLSSFAMNRLLVLSVMLASDVVA